MVKNSRGELKFADSIKNRDIFEKEKLFLNKYNSNMLFDFNKTLYRFYKELGKTIEYIANAYS